MFLSFLGIQRYIICENPSYGTKDMNFARFAYNLTIKTKIGNNWKKSARRGEILVGRCPFARIGLAGHWI
jgi:hypothetical protein